MDNYCVDPRQLFATGYSNGALWTHELAMNPATSNLFRAFVAVDGVTQAGKEDSLKWVRAPADGASCEKLAICLWDSGPPGDDLNDPHGRAGSEWTGTGGSTKPMDIMWRFMQRSVGVPY